MKRGWYINGLKSWRNEMQQEQRLSRARHARLVKMSHPVADDQKALIELRDKFLNEIVAAIKTAQS